jgi:hypothetical protein
VTVEDVPSSLANFGGRISADDASEMRQIIEREFERVDAGILVGSAIALSVRSQPHHGAARESTAADRRLRAAAKRRRHRP